MMAFSNPVSISEALVPTRSSVSKGPGREITLYSQPDPKQPEGFEDQEEAEQREEDEDGSML